MWKELTILVVIVGIAYFIFYSLFLAKRKYNKRLTILKEIGGQTIKEVEFAVKEEELPVSSDDPSNKAWFLVTPKTQGKKYIWPRPPFNHWISSDHCIMYSKSYKGNNYACLIESRSIRKQLQHLAHREWKLVEKDIAYGVENQEGVVRPAKVVKVQQKDGTEAIGFVDMTETTAIVFPTEAHNIKPIFDERLLPEIVSLHTTMNQVFGIIGWLEKYKTAIEVGAVLGLFVMSAIFQIKVVQEVKSGPIEHRLTVETTGCTQYQNIAPEKTPAPPPEENPSPGGIFGDIQERTK